MSRKVTSTIAGASLLITIISILSKGFGFVREIIFAGNFGLGKNFDVYLVSSVIPVTIFTIVYYIAQNYYIPLFAEAKKENYIREFFNKNILIFLLGNIALSIILYLLTNPIVNVYLKSDTLEVVSLAKKIYRLFLICIPFSALNAFIISYFQSDSEYKIPAFSQIIQSILVILFLLILNSSIGILAIPVSFIIGTVFQFVYLLLYSARLLNFNFLSNKINSKAKIFNFSIVYVIIIEVLGQFYLLADRYFFDKVDPGGIAALNYGINVFQLPLVIFTFALSTAIFPKFSKSVVENDVESIKKNIRDIIFINIFIFVPMTFLMYFYGDTLIKIIYQRGKFNTNDTIITFSILKYMSFGLLVYAIYGVFNKLFYSYNLTKVLLAITVAGISLKIILNFILVDYFKQDGLVLSTVITYMFFFISSFVVFRKKIKLKFEMIFISKLSIYFVNGFVCIAITALMPFTGILRVIFFFLLFYSNLFLLKEKTLIYFIDLKNSIIKSRAK